LAAVLLAFAWQQSSALEPKHESGILPIQPPTPYRHYYGADLTSVKVLVIHGLDVSKEVMSQISMALADTGFDVWSIDLPGHGDSTAKFATEAAQEAIHAARNYLGEKTIVLGHSMGAGLLLDLAATESFSTIVLLAPPPVPISEIHADRVLIATGEIDIPRIRSFVPIATDIGNPRVEAWTLPWGLHSAPILNPAHTKRIVEWLGGDGNKIKTWPRILWFIVMLVASLGLGVALIPGPEVPEWKQSIAALFGRCIIASVLALGILRFVNPLGWIRLFATDYLIGFLLLIGLFLLATAIKTSDAQKQKGGIGTALIAALFVIVLPGLIVVSRTLHMTLSDGRWWRFPCIALAGLPLFLSEEMTIRRVRPRWKSDAVAVLMRIVFVAFLLTGVLTLNRDSGFLVLIVPLVAIFWIALWFGTGIVHRRTQNPLAAAVFATLVQGWAFAAWFVTS